MELPTLHLKTFVPIIKTFVPIAPLATRSFPSLDLHARLYELGRIVFLFTSSDFLSILFPIVVFAQVGRSEFSLASITHTVIWVWFHLLQFCVSNQSLSIEEDRANKPWRPLPQNLITVDNAKRLRWSLIPICVFISMFSRTTWISLTFAITVFCNNELGMDNHFVWRNLFNAAGYTAFDLGAWRVAENAGKNSELMTRLVNGLVILTTVQAQDFRDVEGDTLAGRLTLPIYAPVMGRISMLVLLPLWSFLLTWLYHVPSHLASIIEILAILVGLRFFCLRGIRADKTSYSIYNIWLVLIRVSLLIARIS